MSGEIPRPIGSIALVATLLLCGAGAGVPTNTARADDCVTEPNSPAPAGSHWYYHLDWLNQRKCWYLRAPDQPAQQAAAQAMSDAAPASHTIPLEKPATASAGAPMSISPSDNPPPWPHIKMLAAKPQRAPSAATDEPVQQNVQQSSTASSIPATPAPQASPFSQISAQAAEPTPAVGSAPQASSMSQISAQAAQPTPAADPVWPDPPAAAVNAQEPSAVPSDPRTESVQPAADARVRDDAESTAQGDASTTNAAEIIASVTPTTPAEMFPILAVGLVVAGLLFRIVKKIAAARSWRRIIVDRAKSDWIDDRFEHELRDDQLGGSVHEWDELIDDLPRRLIPAITDYSRRRPLRADDEWSDNGRGKDRASDITDEIRKREDMLEQLRRDLDRLMRSPKVA